MNIDVFYRSFLFDVLQEPEEYNSRTNTNVRALPGITFQTDLQSEGFPLLSLRKIPYSFIPEQMWFLSGSNKVDWLERHTKIWSSFKESDNTISSAYGHRWRHWDGGGSNVDQLNIVLKKLKEDNSSRHGVVLMWDPWQDLVTKQKNVPCPYTFTLNIIRGRLNLHLIVRSNDMILGFPTDVAGFALLQLILAQYLEVPPGVYTHSISNAHIYSTLHDSIAEELLNRPVGPEKVEIELPMFSYERATNLDDLLVSQIKENITGYFPGTPIKNIPIAL